MFLSHSCVDEAFCLKRSLAGKQISSITAGHFPLGILFLLHSYHISTFTSSTYTASHATTRLHAALQYFASAKKISTFHFFSSQIFPPVLFQRLRHLLADTRRGIKPCISATAALSSLGSLCCLVPTGKKNPCPMSCLSAMKIYHGGLRHRGSSHTDSEYDIVFQRKSILTTDIIREI